MTYRPRGDQTISIRGCKLIRPYALLPPAACSKKKTKKKRIAFDHKSCLYSQSVSKSPCCVRCDISITLTLWPINLFLLEIIPAALRMTQTPPLGYKAWLNSRYKTLAMGIKYPYTEINGCLPTNVTLWCVRQGTRWEKGG